MMTMHLLSTISASIGQTRSRLRLLVVRRRARAAETGGKSVASAPSTPVPPPVQPRSVEEAVPMKPRAVAPPGVKLDPQKL